MPPRLCCEAEEGILVFFSSRRRHTRYWRDWSSDVCSSDLPRLSWGSPPGRAGTSRRRTGRMPQAWRGYRDRESVVVGESVDLGGRRIIKKKNRGEHLTSDANTTLCICGTLRHRAHSTLTQC